jgi:hypothetical protein
MNPTPQDLAALYLAQLAAKNPSFFDPPKIVIESATLREFITKAWTKGYDEGWSIGVNGPEPLHDYSKPVEPKDLTRPQSGVLPESSEQLPIAPPTGKPKTKLPTKQVTTAPDPE